MATSSITANFYTDDPKAANAIVHALFTKAPPSRLRRPKVRVVEFTKAEERAFFDRLRNKIERERASAGV